MLISAALSQIDEKGRDEAHRKYKILEPFLNKNIPLKIISKKSGVPVRTLNLWLRKYKDNGLKGLARKYRRDKGTPRIYDLDLQKRVEGLYLNNSKLSSASIHRLITEHCKQNSIKEPSYRLVCRIVKSIPDDITVLASQGSNAYQQKYDLLHIRSSKMPNGIWQADHVMMDINIFNDKNQLERPWLTIIIDDCSRVICGYELSFLAPSANKTSLCLRNAIWRKADPEWGIMGVPETLYTDHGSDFTSKHIEQVCIDLKIRLIYSLVGQPRGRGKIERFFRTLNQTLVANLEQITTSYKKGQAIDLNALDKIIYNFIISYNHKIHSELGMTPTERWELNGFLPQILDSLEDLDLLLFMVAKPRQILRDGIRFQGLRYLDPILAEYIGETVLIRYNPSDISSIRVFHQNKFLCQPVCSELSRETVSIKEIQAARRKRKKDLSQKINDRKSLVEAVISASRRNLPNSIANEPLLKTKKLKPGLKLYENN